MPRAVSIRLVFIRKCAPAPASAPRKGKLILFSWILILIPRPLPRRASPLPILLFVAYT